MRVTRIRSSFPFKYIVFLKPNKIEKFFGVKCKKKEVDWIKYTSFSRKTSVYRCNGKKLRNGHIKKALEHFRESLFFNKNEMKKTIKDVVIYYLDYD